MRKSKFNLSIILICLFVVCHLFSNSQFGKDFSKELLDDFRTLETMPIYMDVPLYDISTLNFSKTENYELSAFSLQSHTDISDSDMIFISHPDNIVEYISKFEKNGVIANATITMIAKEKLFEDSNNVVKSKNDFQRNAITIDLSEILIAFTEDKTWEDIGYNNSDKIELFIPNKKSPYYDYVALGIYASLYGNCGDEAEALQITKEVLDKVQEIPSSEKLSKTNQMYIVFEQGEQFKSIRKKNNITYCYPSDGILFPVYMMWNNDVEFAPIYDELISPSSWNKCNPFVDNNGYRPVDKTSYFSTRSRADGNIWASNAVDSINAINITSFEMASVLANLK